MKIHCNKLFNYTIINFFVVQLIAGKFQIIIILTVRKFELQETVK